MKKIVIVSLFSLSGLALAADPTIQDVTPAPSEQTDISTPATSAVAEDATTATEATTAETSTATEEQAGFSRGSVIRSVFTTAIQEREPVDKLNNTDAEQERVFYFTELRDMSGQTAVHRWEKDGDVKAEVKFDVRGPRWRVWSSKSFQPASAGEWKVSVLNGAGEIIAEETLNLAAVPTQQAAEPAATTTESAAEQQPAAEKFEPPVNEQLMQ